MIRYTLRIEKPEAHLVSVTVEVQEPKDASLAFVLPAWSPGSYMIRDYARYVVKAEASRADGKPLPCVKLNKDTWQVKVESGGACRFSYQVYCHEHGVQSSFVDDSHASLHGPSVFAYPEGRKNEPCRVTFQFSEKWKTISTGLNPVEGSLNTFEAPDYDTFIDCPVEIGNHSVHTFLVKEVPHRVALYGGGNLDAQKLVADMKKMAEAAVGVFNHIPYGHYTFIIQLLNERGGGLEHLNSTLIQVGRWNFKPEEEYRKVLSLISHEFFHLWNVKRLAPGPLLRFDYTKENYTDLLWVAEGITSYYDDLILLRAGLYTPEQYFQVTLDDYKVYMESPGRLVQSVRESSFDSWIKFYKLGESFRNMSISYYKKGDLIGLGLDLLIRKATSGRSSLDHVLRYLYDATYLKAWTGYTLSDFKKACEKIAGSSLENFFTRHVEGREDFPLDDFLKLAGLRLVEKKEKNGAPPQGYLGVEWKKGEGRVLVSVVPWSGPAFEAGLCPGDEIVGWDGFRVHPEAFSQRVQESPPGSVHRLQLFREERFREIEVRLGEKPREWKVESVENPDAESLELRKGWLGTAELKREEEKEPARRS